MKNKIVFKSQKDFVKWVTVSNMFAKSRIMPMVALKQFNKHKFFYKIPFHSPKEMISSESRRREFITPSFSI